jgi:hypothetical protein
MCKRKRTSLQKSQKGKWGVEQEKQIHLQKNKRLKPTIKLISFSFQSRGMQNKTRFLKSLRPF